jgi:hypothetical protein
VSPDKIQTNAVIVPMQFLGPAEKGTKGCMPSITLFQTESFGIELHWIWKIIWVVMDQFSLNILEYFICLNAIEYFFYFT